MNETPFEGVVKLLKSANKRNDKLYELIRVLIREEVKEQERVKHYYDLLANIK